MTLNPFQRETENAHILEKIGKIKREKEVLVVRIERQLITKVGTKNTIVTLKTTLVTEETEETDTTRRSIKIKANPFIGDTILKVQALQILLQVLNQIQVQVLLLEKEERKGTNKRNLLKNLSNLFFL